MSPIQKMIALAGLALTFVVSSASAEALLLPERSEGSPNAPVTIVDYSSTTCSHCAHFFNDVMPELKKKYIDTGKVRFIYRDFPLDSVSLKGAALAHCLPKDKFFPFVSVLYRNRKAWLSSPKPVEVMTQYAKLAGLSEAKAKACLDDGDLMDKLIKQRTEAMNKYNIQATPTFIFNDGEERIMGARRIDAFARAIDKILAKKQKK